ncbi:MAG: S4 domain-containing protein [Sedimenticola sp.]|uniref:Heat shock protein 15 n=1 Tax=Sedimenticola thiotaurini TaxID=1543721 RepID=A0A558D7E6_9GAMM|nr:S4 domain-containing protein [Sedimenticola sp.]MCW8949937.1 S4 domain-containing protein [Sedimenticola sp.]MCW9021725.1 S4 domain-containing protein [Sedimenticola sp.]TVT56940.1 MAG: RNA-binding S4 domain-containing protein [Sedimenticola thiotaurini]
MSEQDQPQSIRLDKWLWAARFFKTRQLAIEAINGGKVHLNGQRTKPGKTIGVGSRLTIHKESLEWEVEVCVIPKQRRPASEAVHFYSENETSRLQREKLQEEQRLIRAAAPRPASGKPSKKDRRMIHSFTGKER